MAAIIKVDKVKKYYGDVKALDGVSIGIEEGKIYGLLGPNGAGKTTLISAMSTLLEPDSGSIVIDEVDVVKHPDQIRPLIGLAGQGASVDEFLTGRENLEMIARLYHLDRNTSKKRSTEVLERLNLTDAADRQVKTYSGGMRRRLDLGASLVARPKILFLDEPTTGLDPRTRIELWDIIRELVKANTTILLTTQYLEEADTLADKIGVIDNGKLIAEGTSDSLKNKLGGDVVELKLPRDLDFNLALDALKGVAKNEPIYIKETNSIKVPVSEGSKSFLKIVRALDDGSIEPTEMSLHRPSLDEVFLKLTDKKKTGKSK